MIICMYIIVVTWFYIYVKTHRAIHSKEQIFKKPRENFLPSAKKKVESKELLIVGTKNCKLVDWIDWINYHIEFRLDTVIVSSRSVYCLQETFYFLFFYLIDRVPICSPDWPQTLGLYSQVPLLAWLHFEDSGKFKKVFLIAKRYTMHHWLGESFVYKADFKMRYHQWK